jgi:SAM-dependent methyltransferase
VARNNNHSVTRTRVDVRSLTPSPTAETVRTQYEERFGNPPEKPGGWYRDDDWRRTSYVLEVVRPGTKALDVGAGAGQFANMLAASGKFESVTALDHIRFEKYSEFHSGLTRRDASIVELPFADDEFDVVTCMEVLEHVPDDVLEPGIAELRRVCRGQLIMSVPFEEVEPLSKGHLRRFEAPDVIERFPDASFTLLDRPKMPWLIIEERLDGTAFDEPVNIGNLAATATNATSSEARRLSALEAEVAQLKSLPSVRIERWARSWARRARRRLSSRRPSR